MASTTFFLCFYCNFTSKTFGETIDHEIINHPNNELKCHIKRKSAGKTFLKARHFHVIPADIKSQHKYITANNCDVSISIHNFHTQPENGPSSPKRQKLSDGNIIETNSNNWPKESILESPTNISTGTDKNTSDTRTNEPEIPEKEAFRRISLILLNVISNLKQANELNSFIQYNELLASGSFPFDNIAYRLFCDVIQWYSLSNTSSMRYSDLVKRFWRTGYKLFKGKFIRFMSGLKNTGNSKNGTAEKGIYEPGKSLINFVVPSRSILDNINTPVSSETFEPGLIETMIDMVYKNDPEKMSTFKICVDGKKINSSFIGNSGDVNLWGHEDPPTLLNKQNQLSNDKGLVEQLKELIYDMQQVQNISECLPNKQADIVKLSIELIKVISNKIQSLRKAKVGKQMAYEKFLKLTVGDWRKSKYAFVISSLKTSLFEISTCIEDALSCIDKLGYVISDARGIQHLYCQDTVINLNHQENFQCLVDMSNEVTTNLDMSVVKQRSIMWHEIRNKAQVTGSTCNAALGLETLKKQQMHYKRVFNEKHEVHNFSREELNRLEHGTKNEINCIATLVGKVLPIFFDKLSYFEEGCYKYEIDKSSSMPNFVVSPDGSLRNDVGFVIFGVEVKCPYPGKGFTTPVHYTIPKYYVPQILCEMAALETNKLIFLSYSHESTSVIEASFDNDIWTMICKILEDVYGQDHKIPRKLHPLLSPLRQKICKYLNTHVNFIAEVPSLKAYPCSHKDVSSSTNRQTHLRNSNYGNLDITTIDGALDIALKCMSVIETSYQLLRSKASEVLVFLLSDLDRMSNSEVGHGVPMAYGLKGYSMSTDIMRKMLRDVLNKCFQKGLYIPVVSFDGQWYNLCVRSNTGKPMTLLQLQKDVFKKSKSKTKSSILQSIFSCNKVVVDGNLESLESQISLQYRKNSDGHFDESISVGKLRTNSMPLKPSKHTLDMISSSLSGKVTTDNSNVTNENNTPVTEHEIEDHILSLIQTVDSENTDDDLSSEIEILNKNICLQLRSQQQNDTVTSEEAEIDEVTETGTTNVSHSQTSADDIQSTDIFRLDDEDYQTILESIQKEKSIKLSENIDKDSLRNLFLNPKKLCTTFNKKANVMCLRSIASKLKARNIHFLMSWPKYKITEFLNSIAVGVEVKKSIPNRRRNVCSLQKLCQKVIRTFPKDTLNIIDAEYAFPSECEKWYLDTPFDNQLEIDGTLEQINWFSKPEYSEDTSSFTFFLLDCHHILTNARIKCCKTGIPEVGIDRNAWVKLTKREYGSILSTALVEDLVDCQSNTFAKQTFSEEVERAMRKNGDVNEANFCRLIRDWYSSEDDPGVDVNERCKRRLSFRRWLLQDVDFSSFPPPGSFIKGIPIVMYEGLLTNIERRIQLFPFVKTGVYNVRSLGTLEAENLFGAFQDLDPKGSGVIRPDDLPSALSTACEMLSYRLNTKRGFHLHTSRTRVYPVHEVMEQNSISQAIGTFSLSSNGNTIFPKNHPFDHQNRANVKQQGRKRPIISEPSMPAKGMRPVRQYHRLDESKILPHIRKGIEFSKEID